MKRLFNKARAAKCPVCGKYMEKKALFLQDSRISGDGPYKVTFTSYWAWYCIKCNLEGKA